MKPRRIEIAAAQDAREAGKDKPIDKTAERLRIAS